MYTHARQFPHLAGRSNEEVVAIYRRALKKRPKYWSLWILHYVVIFFAIVPLEIVALQKLAGIRLNNAYIIAGVSILLMGFSWNAVWVNTVAFKITKEEVEHSGRSDSPPAHTCTLN
jgi:hypothetical protein